MENDLFKPYSNLNAKHALQGFSLNKTGARFEEAMRALYTYLESGCEETKKNKKRGAVLFAEAASKVESKKMKIK